MLSINHAGRWLATATLLCAAATASVFVGMRCASATILAIESIMRTSQRNESSLLYCTQIRPRLQGITGAQSRYIILYTIHHQNQRKHTSTEFSMSMP